jgi:hypothetical protein
MSGFAPSGLSATSPTHRVSDVFAVRTRRSVSLARSSNLTTAEARGEYVRLIAAPAAIGGLGGLDLEAGGVAPARKPPPPSLPRK